MSLPSLYDIALQRLDGSPDHMSNYQRRVLLVVNVASQCGFTPQYQELEELYQKFHAKGFEILAFPCNQFGQQEPGSATDIAQFCESRFHVTFPMFQKIDVNGPETHPLYQVLKKEARGMLGSESIKWNFTKFLIGTDGTAVDRFAPTTRPLSLAADIEQALPKGASHP